ncbi:hypothetical protein [Aminobacter sp. MDW-2]|uniref:hypothetical protein n=1 Tax=Aminobacter sp. MDW-2 TaxID=2666139 RepID=UPI0012B04037|nr:hypothetical protein [Aminobacter sp. MDW-2]MRX32814.1 hypothetical protein [Aminobacter sp. MDW-2]QNH34527.1 hypothetical protein H5P29_00805 [Aminobacter sp. MDW-2]
MFSKTIRVGEAVEIGDVACIRVDEKSGRNVRLSFFTDLPIRHMADGLIPARYTHGITGEARRVPVDPVRHWARTG